MRFGRLLCGAALWLAAGCGNTFDAEASGGASGATSGSGGAGGGSGGGGTTTGAGGHGGASGFCGDGFIDPGEECDSAGDAADTTCVGCNMQCLDDFERPETHHCYDHRKEPVIWSDAVKKCAGTKGGYLASITSAEELNFLINSGKAKPPVWIGGSDTASEGVFVWVSGEAWSYANWDVGEPSAGPKANCVQLKLNYKLAAAACDLLLPALCEIPSPGKIR
jgi:hypothetical protein